MSNQQSSGSGGGGDNGNGGEETDDDSSSSSSPLNEPQNNPDLEEFREKWQKELKISDGGGGDKSSDQKENLPELNKNFTEISDDEKAQQLFLQGVDLERHGKVFDAIRLYRRAIQLVPDIEFKIYEQTKFNKKPPKQQDNDQEYSETANKIKSVYENENEDSDDEDLDGVDLIVRFKNALAKSPKMISKSLDKSVITSGAHFVDLPIEIILYILRWVVSSDLDLRSLEQCAAVCRGLYLCARDSEIWRQACIKVWGVNVGTLNTSYLSWRQMFLERERVLYNGCYISKASYLRYGENSFQDQFYRPVQLVEYYRYFRFFADGQVLMMTSADDPQQGVQKLTKQKANRSEIFKGHYRLHNDLIIIVIKRTKQKYDNARNNNLRRGSIFEVDATQPNTFCIEFRIVSTAKRRFCQLQWKHYSIIQVRNKTEVHTDFELTAAKYPPLWFSRVKSYHAEAEKPLDY